MSHQFRAAVVDYDGTLTDAQRPDAQVLDAVRGVRATGRKCVLVTGRILAELRADFPDVNDHFDAIVGENGGVLWLPGTEDRAIATPVDPGLEAALRSRGVHAHRGWVLLATETTYDDIVNEEIARLGLEVQIIRNRGALMVLPAATAKGSGVMEALKALGLSHHSAVGIGDAENDHSLLDMCEIGVAVANAIPSLKMRADLVLARPNGAGVREFLLGPFLLGVPGIESKRWRITLGKTHDGTAVTIPASGVNVEIYGQSGAGKSFMAGLIAEQLMALRYIVCVIDLEGDHVPLADLHGVMPIGGPRTLPEPAEAARLLTEGVSVVVDLSMVPDARKREYAVALLDALHQTRNRCGLPHWIVVEEAHVPMPAGHEGWWCREPSAGFCLVSYRPELVCPHLTSQADVVLTLESPTRAVIVRRREATLQRFSSAARAVAHVRHWHKYLEGRLPQHRHFYFRDAQGLTGHVAGNVSGFMSVVRHAEADVLRYHAARRDFSRWLGDLFRDAGVARVTRSAEERLAANEGLSAVLAFRTALERVVENHFAGRDSAGEDPI
jgi:hydroxymethylpyrimidine pyrophosphatase-like HAD family hydrolase